MSVMKLALADLRAGLPPEFERLREAARTEGYGFLDRLHARWRNSAYDADDQASVVGVQSEDRLVAIGAQTYDEYDPHPEHRRIRHFYVLPEARRHGAGRLLAGELTKHAFERAPRLHLRATHSLSTAFWDAMGFERVARADRTHEKLRQ